MAGKQPCSWSYHNGFINSQGNLVPMNIYYEYSKCLAIIQDFTAHWGIRNKEMVIVWKFDSVRMQDLVMYDSDIKSNQKYCPFA